MKVSIPLRGIGYEKPAWAKYAIATVTELFPSPCGELVMKNLDAGFEDYVLVGGFPSPCGELVMKNVNYIPGEVQMTAVEFPSPCGELVMKNYIHAGDSQFDTDHVSIPLRGIGYEKLCPMD